MAKFDNIGALDWDDSALIKAYNRGMSLRVKDFEGEPSKEKKHDHKKKEWRVGDHCQALYPIDNLMYEARIVAISHDYCTVDFLGYNEEVEVDIDTLAPSNGKKSRKRQIKKATKEQQRNCPSASADGSLSGEDIRFKYSHSPRYSKKKVHHSNPRNHVFDQSVDYAAAESSFQTMYHPPPAHCSGMPPMTAPAPPPMPQCSDLSQNSVLSAMLTSWYMAGYYTGLHQVQKKQRCCCHTSRDHCCH